MQALSAQEGAECFLLKNSRGDIHRRGDGGVPPMPPGSV